MASCFLQICERTNLLYYGMCNMLIAQSYASDIKIENVMGQQPTYHCQHHSFVETSLNICKSRTFRMA